MIKIHAVKRQTGDKISLKDSILTINSIDFDLDNLDIDNTKKVYNQDVNTYDDDGNIVSTETETIINIEVDKDHFFMFHSGNASRFYDIDSNGVIDLSELATLIDDYNANKKDCMANRKKIYDNYMAIEGHNKSTWMAKGK